MGQQQSFTERLLWCLCNNKREELKCMCAQPEFTSDNFNDNVMLELIERKWDSETILTFANVANDDQLEVLLSSAILYSHVISLPELFARMQHPRETIDKHHLRNLFLTACDRVDTAAIRAMIEYKCYLPDDERALRTIIRCQMDRSVVDVEAIQLVLDAHPGFIQCAQQLLNEYIPQVKRESTREQLQSLLQNYIKTTTCSKQNGTRLSE